MALTIRTFRNVRSRICRTDNGVWLAGWVGHLAPEEARIRLKRFVALKSGEMTIGECYGDGTLVRFAGRVIAQSGQEVAIAILGSLSYEPSPDTVRFEAEGLQGTLRSSDGESSFLLMDISPRSLGILIDKPLAPMSEHRMELATGSSLIRSSVKVANCRLDESQVGHYRVGLHLVDTSRLDAARWDGLLEERSMA